MSTKTRTEFGYGLGVRSRLVRKFWDEIAPCPVCRYHAVEVSITSHTLQTWHRFECPNNDCTHLPGRFKASHEEAAANWNERALPHQLRTSPLETEGRATVETVAAGEASVEKHKV